MTHSLFALPEKFKLEILHEGSADRKQENQNATHELVIFWGTWCGECKEKLKHDLLKLDSRPDLKVITINVDKNAKRVKNYVQKEKIELPVYQNPSGELVKEFKITAVPHWALYRLNDQKLLAHEEAYDEEKILKIITK